MAGIAGIFHPATPKPVDPHRIAAMIAAQAHRGPDGTGIWTAPGVGLGQLRHAATDATGSPEPLRSGAIAVVSDAAITNAADLRRQLVARGLRFATTDDREMLLHGWRLWGPSMLDRIDGAFAVAIHDADRGALFLARDRLGERPLHHVALADGSIAFASELKGLLAHPQLRRTPDPTAVADYLAYGYVPDDACLIAGVAKLAAGHFLLVERGGPTPRPQQYWALGLADRAGGSTAVLGEELLDRMRAAVRCRMTGAVPHGALLSGGIGSAAIVALMAEVSGQAVRTATLGFDDPARDERAAAAALAHRFATDHADRIAADEPALIDTLVAQFDEPFADPAAPAMIQASAMMRDRTPTALTGDGVGTVMAGAVRYRRQLAQDRIRRRLPARWRRGIVEPIATRIANPALLAIARDTDMAYAVAAAVTTPDLRAQLLTAEANHALDGYRVEDRYLAAMRDAPARDALDRAQYADLTIAFPASVLTRTDRVGMAAGLAIHQPLLDHRLVAFAATLPRRLRLRGGTGAWLMRRILEPYLPRDILESRRSTSPPPLGDWFRTTLADDAAALAHARMLADTGWFDLRTIARLAEEHRAGRADHGRVLWQLLVLDRSLKRLFG